MPRRPKKKNRLRLHLLYQQKQIQSGESRTYGRVAIPPIILEQFGYPKELELIFKNDQEWVLRAAADRELVERTIYIFQEFLQKRMDANKAAQEFGRLMGPALSRCEPLVPLLEELILINEPPAFDGLEPRDYLRLLKRLRSLI